VRAIDNPLSKNATGGGNNLGRVKHAQGCAVRVVRDTPSEILKPIPHVVRVEYIDQVGMWTVDDKVKAKGLEKNLLCGEDLA
jgi:hypothetical protein